MLISCSQKGNVRSVEYAKLITDLVNKENILLKLNIRLVQGS